MTQPSRDSPKVHLPHDQTRRVCLPAAMQGPDLSSSIANRRLPLVTGAERAGTTLAYGSRQWMTPALAGRRGMPEASRLKFFSSSNFFRHSADSKNLGKPHDRIVPLESDILTSHFINNSGSDSCPSAVARGVSADIDGWPLRSDKRRVGVPGAGLRPVRREFKRGCK